jgi:hypothetical protein
MRSIYHFGVFASVRCDWLQTFLLPQKNKSPYSRPTTREG